MMHYRIVRYVTMGNINRKKDKNHARIALLACTIIIITQIILSTILLVIVLFVRKANMRAIVVPMNAEIVLRVGIYPTTGMYSFT